MKSGESTEKMAYKDNVQLFAEFDTTNVVPEGGTVEIIVPTEF